MLIIILIGRRLLTSFLDLQLFYESTLEGRKKEATPPLKLIDPKKGYNC